MNNTRLAGAAVIIALAATLGACSSGQTLESPAISTPDMSLPLEERIATPNDEQAKALLVSLAEVHPSLSHKRNITRAMSTCSDILGTRTLEKTQENAKIRYTGSEFEATDADAARIVEIVRTNGFCAVL